MPVRLLSLFGSYDFFAKSLPGMLLVVGTFPLLKSGSIPTPDLSRKIIIFIVVLIIVWLLGTLLGEAVHTVAIYFEKVAAWSGKRLRSLKDDLSKITGLKLPRPNELTVAQDQQRISSEGQRSQRINPFSLRIYFLLRSIFIRVYTSVLNLANNLFHELKDIVWGHRSMFKTKLEAPTTSSPFTQQYLVDFVRKELEDKPPHDIDAIYTVIVTKVSNSPSERAFRFQSRYGFCRSMGVVLFLIGITYLLVIEYPSSWWVPSAFRYQPYLLEYFKANTNNVVGMISILLIATSAIFFLASGNYKRRYIEYLMSELFVSNNLLEDKNGGEMS